MLDVKRPKRKTFLRRKLNRTPLAVLLPNIDFCITMQLCSIALLLNNEAVVDWLCLPCNPKLHLVKYKQSRANAVSELDH